MLVNHMQSTEHLHDIIIEEDCAYLEQKESLNASNYSFANLDRLADYIFTSTISSDRHPAHPGTSS
jgi:hypothetical protein